MRVKNSRRTQLERDPQTFMCFTSRGSTRFSQGRLRSMVKFTAQGHKLTETLRPNHSTIKCFPSLYTLRPHYIRPIYCSSFYFVHHVWLSRERKRKRKKPISHTEKQKPHFEETEQASEPESGMARMLELSDQEFLKSMINMLRVFFFFLPYCVAYGILVPWPGIKPVPPAVEAQSLNHWIAREVPLRALMDNIDNMQE